MKLFHKRGGRGQPDFISLIQNYICTRNTVKILNKDFIKAVRGGGGHRFMKVFHKIPVFLLMMASLAPYYKFCYQFSDNRFE